MFKRDRIFWFACGIFAAGLVLAALDREVAVLFFVAAYLLRPTLHAFDLAQHFADERQVQVHSRAGNIAFIAVMLAVAALAIARVARGEFADEMYMILFIGIAARALVGLVMMGDLRRAGVVILGVIGILIAIFGLFEAGENLQDLFNPATGLAAVVGLLCVGLAFLGRRMPRVVAPFLVLVSILLFFYFHLYRLRAVNLAMWMIVASLLTSAACLYLSSLPEGNAGSRRSRWFRISVLSIAAIGLTAACVAIDLNRTDIQAASTSTNQASSQAKEVQGISGMAPFAYHPNGALETCTLAAGDTVSGQPLPKGTVIRLREDGTLDFAFLQNDQMIQGVMCKGSGHGFQTCFHPNGKLRVAWLVDDQEIQGVPCAEYSFWADITGKGAEVEFHEDGALAGCRLSDDYRVGTQVFEKGTYLNFGADGIVSVGRQ